MACSTISCRVRPWGSCVIAWCADMGWRGLALLCSTLACRDMGCRAMVQRVVAGPGVVWHSLTHCTESWLCHCVAWHVLSWLGMMWIAVPWSAVPWSAMTCHSRSGPGMAWLICCRLGGYQLNGGWLRDCPRSRSLGGDLIRGCWR